MDLYAKLKKEEFCAVVFRQNSVKGFPSEDVYFVKENSKMKFDYWLITKNLGQKRMICQKKGSKYKPVRNLKIFSDDDEITPESKIQFVKTTAEHALYYRDLFCHKLGDTKSEMYFLGLIDGKLFATCGFHMSDLFKLKTDKIFETYGFCPPTTKYKNLNKLFMLAIYCQEFRNVVVSNASVRNRIYDLNGLRTTCLSKYRDVKINNGILKIYKTEKLPNDLYKTTSECEFHPWDFIS